MPLTPFPVEEFGGLNLTGDPSLAGATIARDLRNVRVDSPGELRARGGFDTINSTALVGVVGFLGGPDGSGGAQYVSWSNTSTGVVRVYDVGLATHGDQTVATSTFTGGGVARLGGVLLARSGDVILRVPYSTAAAGVGSSPYTHFLGETGVEGRYVAAYADLAAPPRPYRVHFSNPGNVFTWGVDDFVDLWSSDGQQIHGLTTFRDQVFVFKDRRFAVFYGEGIDQDGGAIFNYRPVDVGIGCAYDHAVATGPDGVYFIAKDGIYRTVGDAPTLISGALQPLFDGATDSDWTGPTSIVTPRLRATQDRLYFINDADVFSYHYATGMWTFDTYASGVQFIAQTPTGKPRSVYFIDGAGKACEVGDGFADDDGVAISWTYTSGRYPLADPGHVAITQESSMVGTGTVTLALDSDLYATQSGAVTLGISPAIAEGWLQRDQEGTWIQHTLSGTGPASVSRLTHHVRFVRPAGDR